MSRASTALAAWAARPDLIAHTARALGVMQALRDRGELPDDLVTAIAVGMAVAFLQQDRWAEQDMHELMSLIWSLDPEPDEPEPVTA